MKFQPCHLPNMRDMRFLLLLLFCLCHCECNLRDRALQAQALKDSLLNNYTSPVAPSDAVEISVTFDPISIIALKEASQVFRFSGALAQMWTDPRLTWDLTAGPELLGFETNEIWTPDLFIPNGVGDTISNVATNMPVRVFNNGQVIMHIITEFQTICNLDITRYPYDEQVCSLSLMTMFETNLAVGHQNDMDLFSEYFTGSSEWKLLDTSMRKKDVEESFEKLSYLDIVFRLRRHSIFYTLSIIFPMCLLSVLNSCVFLLPAASGEKVAYLLSIFVSAAVFLNFINETIPRSSNASRLTIYLVLLLSQSALAVFATLFIMNVHHNQGTLPCATRKKAEADNVKNDHAIGKLDKFLFVSFIMMAAASVLVFFI